MKIAKDTPCRRWCPSCRNKVTFNELANYRLQCPQCQAVLTEEEQRQAVHDENDRLLGLKG
jgi:transcription initiation factor IIE alpha subunit